MKLIILCGGIGTRLKEETEFKPKPMVLVGGKPLLWHIMKLYQSFGFNEFILALGYKSEYIKDYFSNKKNKEKFKITFVDTGLETLPGERILKCAKYIPQKDKYFMVTYGDGISDINIKKVLSFHKSQKTLATVSGVHPRSKYGLFKIGGESLVKSFKEKPVLSEWVNGGYMIFNRTALKYFHNGSTELDTLRELIKEKKLSIYKHEGFWFAIDTYKELSDLNKIWDLGNPPWVIWK